MNKEPLNETGNPRKAYNEELHNEGSTFADTPAESDARDRAKIEKASAGDTQKMDGVDASELEDDGDLADEIRRETLEKK